MFLDEFKCLLQQLRFVATQQQVYLVAHDNDRDAQVDFKHTFRQRHPSLQILSDITVFFFFHSFLCLLLSFIHSFALLLHVFVFAFEILDIHGDSILQLVSRT